MKTQMSPERASESIDNDREQFGDGGTEKSVLFVSHIAVNSRMRGRIELLLRPRRGSERNL